MQAVRSAKNQLQEEQESDNNDHGVQFALSAAEYFQQDIGDNTEYQTFGDAVAYNHHQDRHKCREPL